MCVTNVGTLTCMCYQQVGVFLDWEYVVLGEGVPREFN